MNIVHVGAAPSPRVVDGVNTMIWYTAVEQARLGHNVTLLLDQAPDEHAERVMSETGLKLVYARTNKLSFERAAVDKLIAENDLFHLHSVFVPRQATLARRLVRADVPYIVTPNGGLSPTVLRRGRLKKSIYSFIAERPRIRAAAAVSVVVPGEAGDVRSFLGTENSVVRWVPNPVDPTAFQTHSWQGLQQSPRVVFLGRFDVLHKGLDLFWEIARRMPSVQFDLYGTVAHRATAWFERLRAQNLPNIHVRQPVYGEAKTRVLAEASLYLQTSRWEGFPLSIAEAMFVGVPVAIANRVHVGKQFEENDLGPTFSANPDEAAAVITKALSDGKRLEEWSKRAKEFAYANFTPRDVAQNFIDLYRQFTVPRKIEQPAAASVAMGVARN